MGVGARLDACETDETCVRARARVCVWTGGGKEDERCSRGVARGEQSCGACDGRKDSMVAVWVA